MAEKYRVGVIGAGKPWRSEGATGFGMSHQHMQGYLSTDKCIPVAVADIVEENAQSFAEKYGMEQHYTDYHKMLVEANLDIVSIATWPHLHAEMVVAAANAGVKAIHCEKPMARTWGEARLMVEVCDREGVQLTFNHQRRFLEPFRKAKEIAHSGEIGEITRIEGQTGDIFDWGTHWLDMFFMYNNETPAEWVIGQIDSRQEKRIFGHPVENQAIILFKWQNGVKGYLETGYQAGIGAENRIRGTHGFVEVHNDQPCVRVRGKGDTEIRGIETSEGIHGNDAIARGIADLLNCLGSGQEPELSAHRAIRSTEVIFATYESSRRRGRVDLPLEEYDNAFIEMLEAGDVGPNART
ncbi:MAG: Gfo/Idh/MocA family oxidoreductase [Armatimonadetes bacterium]|nr:Gfo/Idh/MocA family oxidoreductase [Armatimonadota bacterium]